ncbi:MAG: excinuclease ABC subunit UvrA [Candidatus Dependentiae bacterium]|jgi:excinuclease ABC subunit A
MTSKKMDATNSIIVTGAREHNLKNLSTTIPKNKLVIVTGPSGSGKSSLALDTLYAEGRRRYVESLSSYARQFLGVSRKPDVDKIQGLCPAIAIDQKTVGYNPRSTVGTITEIYDYLRVLYARIGVPHCANCKTPIREESPQTITRLVLDSFQGKDITWAAPIAIERKGEFTQQILSYFDRGYYRYMIDGTLHRFRSREEVEALRLPKTHRHTIDVVLDRFVVSKEERVRVQEAIERAFTLTQGFCKLSYTDEKGEEHSELYSAERICINCGSSFPEMEPRLFSFNSPVGACRTCHGLGFVHTWQWQAEGTHSKPSANPKSNERWGKQKECPGCHGQRLCADAAAVTVNNVNIITLSNYSIEKLKTFLTGITLGEEHAQIAEPLLKEISNRVGFLYNVGLSYLTLARTARTLSGGEGQRIRLATQIGSALSGVLYVLDEPSIGLHQRDNDRLIATLKTLRDQGNSVLVVEHDMDTIAQSDYVIDIGPAAGELGGKVVACGTPAQLRKDKNSLTGAYLSGKQHIPVPTKRRTSDRQLKLTKIHTNNLAMVDLTLPLGVLTGISGVSGSGKSSLIMQTLAPALTTYFSKGYHGGGEYDQLIGAENLNNCVLVNQSPIGRTPRSNPATYLGIFDEIRNLFTAVPESKARGYQPGRFSFNVPKGRCSKCRGDGKITIEMHFLEDVEIECKVCRGQRYNSQTLEILFNGKNIAEVLHMSVREALEFFAPFQRIAKRLKLMSDVGLDYIRLGQPSTTLSGGEAQRIKLVNELAKRGTNTFYILDEPTTGLHSHDVAKLITVLQRLVDQGNTVAIIEHNLDVLKCVDHLIDIGPEGGDRGGHIVAAGTPEQVSNAKASVTGAYLKGELT